MDKFNVYVDNTVYSDSRISDEIKRFFKNVENGWLLRSVGIFIGKESHIFLPKNIDIELITYNDINILVNVLLKVNKQSNKTFGGNEFYLERSNSFLVINEIINDFTKNGLYVNKKREIKNKEYGKINWTKSFNGNKPLIIEDEIYYLQLKRHITHNNFDILSDIHSYVLSEISSNVGEIMNNFHFNKITSLSNKALSDLEIINILNKYRRKVNDQRTLHLIKYLILYFKNKQSNNNNIILVTEEFYYVWETMIKSVFKHQQKYMQKLSKPQWVIKDPSDYYLVKKGTNDHIPDALIITEHDGKKYLDIIDAKYYDLSKVYFNKKSNLMEMSSIVKQYFYEFSMNYKETHLLNGRNYFALPYFRLNRSSKFYYEVGEFEIYLPEFGKKKIGILYIPTYNLMEYYLNNINFYL